MYRSFSYLLFKIGPYLLNNFIKLLLHRKRLLQFLRLSDFRLLHAEAHMIGVLSVLADLGEEAVQTIYVVLEDLHRRRFFLGVE